jgi:uncharacterized protein (TIGR03437 family)
LKKLFSLLNLVLTLFAAGALYADTTPTVSVDKPSLSFSAQVGGAAQSQSLTINSNPSATTYFVFTNTSNPAWLKVKQGTGDAAVSAAVTTPATVTIVADPTGLAAGQYTANISVLSGAVGGPSVQVPVTFAVGAIGVSPSSLALTYQVNSGAFPSSTTLNLSAGANTNFVAAFSSSSGAWLSVPSTGTAPGTLLATPNTAAIGSMTPGTYNGTITITPSSGPAATVPVTLTVTPAPTVTANPTTVNLNYQIGGSTGATNTPTATVTLANPGTQTVFFGATSSSTPAGWLTVTPSGSIPPNGQTPLTIAYATSANLPAGTYTGNVTIILSGAANTQISIPIRLLISTSPLLTVPNSTLSFNYQLSGALPAAQTVLPTSSAVSADSLTGQMPITVSATTDNGGNWLVVPTGTVLTGAPFSVNVNPAGLAVGTYTGTVKVTGQGAGNGPQTVPVTLTVSNDPLIVASFNGCSTQNTTACTLNFPIQTGQTNTTTQNITVTSSTGAQAGFAATVSMDPSTDCGTAWLATGVTTAQVGATATIPITVTPGTIASGKVCTGTITITGTNATTGATLPNSPVTIPVKMYVSSSALLVASPAAVSFTLPTNGVDSKALTITSTSTNLNFTATTPSADTWLTVFPSGSNSVTLIANANGLTARTYTSSVTITSPGVLDSPLVVPVTLTVPAATMAVTPSSLSFTQTKGGPAPDSKTLTVATNNADILFNVSVTTAKGAGWLSATTSNATATGSAPATITVSVNGANLAPDTYQGAVTITSTTSTSNSPVTIPVTLEVKPGSITVTPASLSFAQVQGGPAPQSQSLAVAGAPGALSYTVTTSVSGGAANWLSVDAATGTTPGTVKVTANGAGLQPATYTGSVVITSTGATGSPVTVPVTLVVGSAQSITVSPASVNFSYTIGASTAPAQQSVQLATTVGTPFTTNIVYSGASGQNWLSVSPASSSGPGTLNVNVNPAGLAAGNYTATVQINSTAAASNPAASVTVNLTVQAVPKPVFTAVANAASYVNGPVSAGENVVIFGAGLGPAAVTLGHVTGNAFDTMVSDTQVFFDNTPAPIVYVSANQTSVMVPYGVAGRATTNIRVVYKGVQSDPITYNVVATAPGVYTANAAGSGQGAILNQDFTYNGSALPAAKNSVVAVYMTGEGVTSPASADGVIAPSNGTGLFKPLANVTATVGGVPATVEYYGSAPGILYGVMQVNVRIPANAASGNQPIVVTVGTNTTQPNVTVAVQ